MRRLSWLAAVLMLVAACDRSEKEWRAAAAANTIAGYEQFRTRHPDSEQSSEAEARIEALSRRAAIDSALRTGTQEALERVLARYPKDPAAAQVRKKLEELHYDAAAAVDSIRGWETFLQTHAQSPFIAKAQQRLQAILDERDPEFRNVKTVRIEITEDYGEARGVKLPYSRVASEIFPHAGVQVVSGDADAVLVIRSSGRPHGARYTTLQFGVPGGGRFLYTAVDFSGSATLRAGAARLTVPFRHDVDVPHSTTGGSASPDHAPFEQAFSASVPLAIRLLVGRVFGSSPLLSEITATDRIPDPSAARALGALEPPPTERLIAILRTDRRSSARWAAVVALGEAKALAAATPLLESVRADPSLRTIAAEALAKIGSDAVPLLLQSLEHRSLNSDVLICTIDALGRIGDARAAGPLVARLANANDDAMHCTIARALGKLGDRNGLLAVIGLLGSPSSAVRTCSAKALVNEFESAPVWEVPSADVRVLLEGNRGAELVEGLLRGLDAGDAPYEVESAIFAMLGAIGDSAVPRLVEALKHPNARRRAGAAKALGRFHGDERLVPALTAALRGALSASDVALAAAASGALGMLGDDRAVEVLLAAIESPDPKVRSNAIHALGSIGSPRAIAPLKALRARGQSTSEAASALSMIEANLN